VSAVVRDARPYQAAAVAAALDALERWRSPILVMATGCHRAGQGILLADGSVKTVEHVAVGDRLAGPSGQREVLSLARGFGEMVEIVPVKGDPWVVNLDHVLTLVRMAKSDPPRFPSHMGGEMVDVTVREWLTWPKSRKHLHKLVRSPFDFTPCDPPTVDPYVVGAVLGDGSAAGVHITTPDREIWGAFHAEARRWGLRAIETWPTGRCPGIRIAKPKGGNSRNALLDGLRSLGVVAPCHEKRIPPAYLRGSRPTRLDVLAGLLDTDGHMTSGGFDYISKSEGLSRDVAFVARSLGLAAYIKPAQKFCQAGAGGTYWRVSISGDCDIVPTRVPRKQAPTRRQKKDVLRTGFTVRPLGAEPFYGFTLDGDGRYLLDDFTITHNSGKTTVGAEVVSNYLARGRVLWLAHREELLEQAAARMRSFGLDARIEQGKRRAGDAPVVVASVASMVRRLEQHRGFALVVVDECFPRGTLVDGVPIEDLRVGDFVRSYDHAKGVSEQRRVVRLYSTTPKTLVTVVLDDGRLITCTAGHPFFTGGQYVAAVNLKAGDELYGDQAKGVHRLQQTLRAEVMGHQRWQDLLGCVQGCSEGGQGEVCVASVHGVWRNGGRQGAATIGPRRARAGVLRRCVQDGGHEGEIGGRDGGNEPPVCKCSDDQKQPDALGGHEGEGPSSADRNRTQASGERRERSRADGDGGASPGGTPAGVVHGPRCADETAACTGRVSDELQARPGAPSGEAGGGGGWPFSRGAVETGPGHEEAGLFGVARVVRVEAHERRGGDGFGPLCPGDRVYNIEVEGNHNYFADGILVHNCHHAAAASHAKILAHYGVPWLGLTATPGRADGADLGGEIVYSYGIREAVADGYLVRPVGQVVRTALDVRGLRLSGGDYTAGSAEEVITPGLPDWCRAVADLRGDRPTVMFTPGVQSAHAAAEVLRGLGVRAEAADGGTSSAARADILARYEAGELDVLVNCLLWTEGWDSPRTSCVAIARPTRNAGLYQQMAGRGLRTAPGKSDCLVLDLVDTGCDLVSVTAVTGWGEGKERAQDGPVDVLEALDAAMLERETRARYVAACEEVDLLARKVKRVKPTQLGIDWPGCHDVPEIDDMRRIMAAGLTAPGCACESRAALAWLDVPRGCTVVQARALHRYGCRTDLDFGEAQQVMVVLAQYGWRDNWALRAALRGWAA